MATWRDLYEVINDAANDLKPEHNKKDKEIKSEELSAWIQLHLLEPIINRIMDDE